MCAPRPPGVCVVFDTKPPRKSRPTAARQYCMRQAATRTYAHTQPGHAGWPSHRRGGTVKWVPLPQAIRVNGAYMTCTARPSVWHTAQETFQPKTRADRAQPGARTKNCALASSPWGMSEYNCSTSKPRKSKMANTTFGHLWFPVPSASNVERVASPDPRGGSR